MNNKFSIGIIILALFFMPFQNINAQSESESKIQLALILDTSSSMDGLIDQAKTELWTVVNELAKAQQQNQAANLEIALYEYGNDRLEAADGYIRKVLDLTDDLDLISEKLFALSTNGGYEYCGYVIDKATSDLNWSKSDKDLKLIFIAGNEEFTQGTVDYKKSCKTAKENGILVNTIFCGDYEDGIRINWKDGADIALGEYLNIDQNETVAYIKSPYDDKITELSSKLNDTYIAYGKKGKMMSSRQKKQDSNVFGNNKGAAVNRAVSKSSRIYKNSSWDIVDAVDEENLDVTKLEKEQLPKEMQNMNDEEKTEYIKHKKEERVAIQAQIQDLNTKREKYVAEKRKENAENNQDETLGAALKKLIRKQAEAKNYTFDK